MAKEAAALRADIARYRRSLLAVNDPDATKMLEQMIKDAEGRLDAVERRDARQTN